MGLGNTHERPIYDDIPTPNDADQGVGEEKSPVGFILCAQVSVCPGPSVAPTNQLALPRLRAGPFFDIFGSLKKAPADEGWKTRVRDRRETAGWGGGVRAQRGHEECYLTHATLDVSSKVRASENTCFFFFQSSVLHSRLRFINRGRAPLHHYDQQQQRLFPRRSEAPNPSPQGGNPRPFHPLPLQITYSHGQAPIPGPAVLGS